MACFCSLERWTFSNFFSTLMPFSTLMLLGEGVSLGGFAVFSGEGVFGWGDAWGDGWAGGRRMSMGKDSRGRGLGVEGGCECGNTGRRC